MKRYLVVIAICILSALSAFSQNECPQGTYPLDWGNIIDSSGVIHQNSCWDFTGKLTFPNLNAITASGIVNASTFNGVDACAKIANAIASLPATGGTVDARGLQGAQNCGSDPFSSSTVPVQLLIGKSTITSTVGWTLPSNTRIIGLGKDKSQIVFNGTIVSGMTAASTSNNIEVASLGISASAKTVTFGIYVNNGGSGQNVSIHDNKISGFGNPSAGNQGAVSLFNTQDVWIYLNEFTNNGVGTAGGTSSVQNTFDIGVNGSAGLGVQKRLHIWGNYIHDSLTTISMQLFDVSESDIYGNSIDQDNVIFSGLTTTGYGIMVYEQGSSANPPINDRIENNLVKNAAGIGIYYQGGYGGIVSNNTVSNTVQQQTNGGSLEPSAIKVNEGSVTPTIGGHIVTGNVVDTSGRHGISVAGSMVGGSVCGNTIRNTTVYGIYLSAAENYLSICGNELDTVGVGVYSNGAAVGVSVTGNTIHNYGNGASNKGAIYINGAATDWSVSSNTITSAVAGQCILFVNAASTRNVITSNIINATGGTAANCIDYRGTLPTIVGNQIQGATAVGISVSGTSAGGIIASNVITSPTTYGISVTGTTPTTAIGKNTITGAGTASINPASVVSDYFTSGTKTLSSGAGSLTFPVVYTAAPICTCTDSTAAAAVKCSTSTTTLTLAGTSTDVINYSCQAAQ